MLRTSGKISTVTTVMLAGWAALFATPAGADIDDFVGQWVNADRDTSGVTRVEVTRRAGELQMRVFGQCGPRDCDWGMARADIYANDANDNPIRDATAISGRFNAGFAQKFIILHEARGDMLTFDVYTNFTDRSRRTDYVMQGRLRPASFPPGRGFPPPGGPGGPGPGPLVEDCMEFSPATIQVLQQGGSWRLTDRGRAIADFGNNRAEALRALDIVKNYRFSSQCFVGGQNPSMTYWKAGAAIPGGGMPGEDCMAFIPEELAVQRMAGSWKIADRGRAIADFGDNRDEAERSLDVIRQYDLNRQCFVGRPNPSMAYWLSR
jgi:hypothetical protein